MSPWACPDPELWEQVASELNYDILVEYVLRHVHLQWQYGGGATLESLGVSPWLLTDLLDRAERAEWTESDTGELSLHMTDLLHFIERAHPHEWVARSNLAERLLRWAESDDTRLVSMAYAMGLKGNMLPDTNTVRLLHLKLMVRVVESRDLQDSNMKVNDVLMSPFFLPDIPDEEVDVCLRRIAAKAKNSKRCAFMTRNLVGAATNSGGVPTLSPSVIEAWVPLIHRELLTDACRWSTIARAVRIDPEGTWRNRAIRRKIITRLSLDMRSDSRLASRVMATWTEPGVRCLLKEARVVYGDPGTDSPEGRNLPRKPGEKPIDRDAAMRRVLAAAGARYPELLTEDEALVLCMSPDSSERQVGMLASAEATPTPHPATRSTLPQSTNEEVATAPTTTNSPT